MRKKPLIQNKLPSVSVIIPTYNNGNFIKDALESLFNQTYPEELIEIIVVDDGSTDDTNRILGRYKEKIIYVYKENKGVASARNLGISLSKNEIITFLDSDDIWHEERLLRVVEKFNKRQDIGIVYHPFEVIDSRGSVIYKNFYKLFGYTEGLSGWITNDIFSGHIFCGGSSFAFRRSVIEKIYPVPEDMKRGIDYYITAISSFYASAAYIPDVLGKYRLHSRNTTMRTGQNSSNELAAVNKDFAHMRQKVIEKKLNLDDHNNKEIDLNIIKRMQAKEIIFYNVLSGKRLKGIKHIPLLFKGNLPIRDLSKSITVSFMALFVPSFLFSKLLKVYGLFKKLIQTH
jgi:glycosyltransferase involved in cell wall biosynthesis